MAGTLVTLSILQAVVVPLTALFFAVAPAGRSGSRSSACSATSDAIVTSPRSQSSLRRAEVTRLGVRARFTLLIAA